MDVLIVVCIGSLRSYEGGWTERWQECEWPLGIQAYQGSLAWPREHREQGRWIREEKHSCMVLESDGGTREAVGEQSFLLNFSMYSLEEHKDLVYGSKHCIFVSNN